MCIGQGRVQRLEQPGSVSYSKRVGDVSSIDGFKSFCATVDRFNSTSINRQHLDHGVHKSSHGSEPLIVQSRDGYMGGSYREWNHAVLFTYCGKTEYYSRQLVKNSRQAQLDVTPCDLQLHRQDIPHTIDRFANCQNAQVERFNSRYWERLSEGVDALAQSNWASGNSFINAPFCLIPCVLDVIQEQRACATINAPLWKAQPWYQLLVNNR